jgi:hypothetical protein
MFFGLATNVLSDPWPGTMIPLSGWRTLGSQVKWADINTAAGVYNFTKLDRWMNDAKATGTDVLFTVYATPTWISSRGINCTGVGTPDPGCLGPANTQCAFQSQNGPGICDPPQDLACDGTGTNQAFIDFITALINHVGPGAIKYWEMWNEPSYVPEWNAIADCPSVPDAQYLILARMARDLKRIVSAADPNAKFTSPPLGDANGAASWLPAYFAKTDASGNTDVIGFHGYIQLGMCPQNCPVAEKVGSGIDLLVSKLPQSEQGKPLFDTEGSWGTWHDANNQKVDAISDPDQQQSFLARYYLIQMSHKISRLYWWIWDTPGFAAMYDSNTNTLTATGNAHIQMVRWTLGGTATVSGCTASGTIWTCTLSYANQPATEAIWDTSQTCNAGTCTTSTQSVPSQFNAYLDLAGNTNAISGSTAPVGLKPILLFKQ